MVSCPAPYRPSRTPPGDLTQLAASDTNRTKSTLNPSGRAQASGRPVTSPPSVPPASDHVRGPLPGCPPAEEHRTPIRQYCFPRPRSSRASISSRSDEKLRARRSSNAFDGLAARARVPMTWSRRPYQRASPWLPNRAPKLRPHAAPCHRALVLSPPERRPRARTEPCQRGVSGQSMRDARRTRREVRTSPGQRACEVLRASTNREPTKT